MACALLEIVAALEAIAPPALAADWDNTGLLIEPAPASAARIERVLFTIDLTEPVLAEALREKAELIVAYHPPIFAGLKRLTQTTAAERVVSGALKAGLFVYSPHTALDACREGLNDWLADALGPGRKRPIEPVPGSEHEGQGRLLELTEPLYLEQAVANIKRHLGLEQLRVARPAGNLNPVLRSVAVCAGAGGSLLSRVEADLLVTGEMRHHDILGAVAGNKSVVVCDHTHTERGFLPLLIERVRQRCAGDLNWLVSRVDGDPLRIE